MSACTDVRGDVRDATALTAAMAEHRPDVVFHLAAQPLVRASYAEPRLHVRDERHGHREPVRGGPRDRRRSRAVVNVTSDKCYENREWVYAYREIDPMGGYDPYSLVEGVRGARDERVSPQLLLGRGRRRRLASVRAGNVIGGGDWAPDRIVPDCVRALSAGESILVRNPTAVRPWQHVLEPLSGLPRAGGASARRATKDLDGGVELRPGRRSAT